MFLVKKSKHDRAEKKHHRGRLSPNHIAHAEIFQRWAGTGGQARFLTEDETARQVLADEHFKTKKRKDSGSLGNLDQISSIMVRCLDLQGKPAENKDDANAQRKTSRLVVQCVNRAQAQKERELLKKPRVADQNPSSDTE